MVLPVLPLALAIARSKVPFPSKSPTAIELGKAPSVVSVAPAVKVPSPFPSQIRTPLVLPLVTARSSLPSPLKSATAMDDGDEDAGGVGAAVKVPSPLPNRMDR